MARASKQTLANCTELVGLIGMFAIDAETEADRMTLAGVILAEAIRAYERAHMEHNEIDEVLKNAMDTYKRSLQKKKK